MTILPGAQLPPRLVPASGDICPTRASGEDHGNTSEERSQNAAGPLLVQVGEKEYIMKPEIDLPEISIESALEEESELIEYMKRQRINNAKDAERKNAEHA